MSLGNLSALGLLFTLLPGLLMFLTIHQLTSRAQEIKAPEVLLKGLAYTLVINATWAIFGNQNAGETYRLAGTTWIAIVLGFAFSMALDNGIWFSFLRKIGLTRDSGWTSEWITTFRFARENGYDYAVLYLKDGSKLMGAIKGYSPTQNDGHVVVENAAWIDEENECIEAPGIIIVRGCEISSIQFVESED